MMTAMKHLINFIQLWLAGMFIYFAVIISYLEFTKKSVDEIKEIISTSQIKIGMADWQIEEILGKPFKEEGQSYCFSHSHTSNTIIWYYSVERKDGPYIKFKCNTSAEVFEVTNVNR